jgi:murein DD-endopeptidase MepM/ murein hydrolase activator NlpD
MVISADFKARARTFGIGAACGFLAGAVFVGTIVSRYPRAGSAPSALGRTAPAVRSDDGLANVDAPVLVEGDAPAAAPPGAATAAPGTAAGTPTTARSADPTATIVPPSADELKRRGLAIPVEGIKPEQLVESFSDERSGTRVHEAIDILAPRNTPVKAVEDGTIARLFYSKAGGTTIYQFDPTEQFCYYYAHLERYADGLHEGDHVRKGQVLGYVGTSGNAPKDTPHLHFAVFRLTAAKHWWEGTPMDPYPILR